MALIKCPECGKEVSSGAESCPNCGHPISKKGKKKKKGSCLSVILFIIIAFVALFILIPTSDEEGGNGTDATKSAGTEVTKTTETEVKKEYIVCTVDELVNVLNDNALKAEETYKGKYLEVTGRLGVIDSSGKYISLYNDDMFSITGVQCYIKSDEQKKQVLEMSIDDKITLKGKCKSVGELMGYSLDIEEIK